MGNQHSGTAGGTGDEEERGGWSRQSDGTAVLQVRGGATPLRDGSGHVVDANADDEVMVALASAPTFSPLRPRGADPATTTVVVARIDAGAVLRLLAVWQAHAGRRAVAAAAQQDALAARVLACDERANAVLAQQQRHTAIVVQAVAELAHVAALRRTTRSIAVRAEFATAAAHRVAHALDAIEQRLRTFGRF